jgi:hypothetical protein
MSPTPRTVDFIEACVIPIIASSMGIYVKWAISRDRPRRLKREYINVGFDLILAAFLVSLFFSLRNWTGAHEAEETVQTSVVQLMNLDRDLPQRVEDPDLGAFRIHCKHRALEESGTKKSVGNFDESDLARFERKKPSSIADPERRAEVATCQTFLAASDRSTRLDSGVARGLIFALIVLPVTWFLSVYVQDRGHETNQDEAPWPRRVLLALACRLWDVQLAAKESLNLRMGILLPDAVGIALLVLAPIMVAR